MPKKSKKFKGHTVEFEADENTKKVTVTHNGGKKEPAKEGDVDVLPVDKDAFDGEIIATSSNPTCFWYRYNGQWYVYCC